MGVGEGGRVALGVNVRVNVAVAVKVGLAVKVRVGGRKGVKVTDGVQVGEAVWLGVVLPGKPVRLGVTVLCEGGAWVVMMIPGVGVGTLRALAFNRTTTPTQ